MQLGETVNALIDGLFAAADRLLQLPLFVVLPGLCGLVLLLALPLRRFARRPERAEWRRGLWIAQGVLVLAAMAFVADRRLAAIETSLRELATRHDLRPQEPARGTTAGAASKAATPRALQFDLAAVRTQLADTFGELQVQADAVDDAVDYVQLRVDSSPLRAYLAIVDLRAPGLQVVFEPELQKKTRTTAFAEREHCLVAVNGEAGLSPFPNSGLGNWTGHFVWRGEVLLREQAGNPRPFLAFDRDNKASFRAMSAEDRSPGATPWNVIWGRFDCIVDGEVQIDEAAFQKQQPGRPMGDRGSRQPRTAMGIDRDGRRLYLMVVDGRQPRFSMGASRAEVGLLLKPFGAHDVMLCDEGGSSCLFVQALGGLVNSPSDGQERVTYTHFGIARAVAK